jgi:hypothetical protein
MAAEPCSSSPRFINEDQARRIKVGLILLPTRAVARHLRPILFAGQNVFLKLSHAMDEIPHRAVADDNAALSQFGLQMPQCHARFPTIRSSIQTRCAAKLGLTWSPSFQAWRARSSKTGSTSATHSVR